MRELLFVLLLLACPLAMLLMMRGGHGHGGHGHAGSGRGLGDADGDGAIVSTEELRARRDELDRLIADREQRRERQQSRAER